MYKAGRHFLQIPGPTNVPGRVLRALSRPTIDHRGSEFARLTLEVLENIKRIFQTSGSAVIFPSSGTGAWEAALVNTLSPGDKVLMFETGHFSTLWCNMAKQLGLVILAISTTFLSSALWLVWKWAFCVRIRPLIRAVSRRPLNFLRQLRKADSR